MGDNFSRSYLYLKGKTYYFNRHVPLDLKGHYKTRRIRLCLNTASPGTGSEVLIRLAVKLISGDITTTMFDHIVL